MVVKTVERYSRTNLVSVPEGHPPGRPGLPASGSSRKSRKSRTRSRRPSEGLLGLAMLSVILCGLPSQMFAAESNSLHKPPTPGGRDVAPRLNVELDGVHVGVTSDGKHAILSGDMFSRTSRVSKETIELICDYPSVERLHFELVVIDADSLKLLKRLPNLTTLVFVRTSADDEVIASLTELEGITTITIADCLITDRSIPLFARIPSLEWLALQRNRFMPWTARKDLKRLLPSEVNLQVYPGHWGVARPLTGRPLESTPEANGRPPSTTRRPD